MIARRALLTGMGALVVAAGAWTAGAYRASMEGADARLARRSSVIDTGAGAMEYGFQNEVLGRAARSRWIS